MADGVKTSLVDEFFLIKSDTRIYQGQIVADLGEGYYLCQFFSGIAGERTCRKIAHIAVMSAWQFYDNAEMWRDAGSRALA